MCPHCNKPIYADSPMLVSETKEIDEQISAAYGVLRDPDQPSIAEIARITATNTGVSVSDMRGPSRLSQIADARHIAIYVARENGHTLSHIGNYFNRDHTSVVHAHAKIAARRASGQRVPDARGLRKERGRNGV